MQLGATSQLLHLLFSKPLYLNHIFLSFSVFKGNFPVDFPTKFFMNSLFLRILVTCQPVYALHHHKLTTKFGQYKPLFIKHIILNYLPIYSFSFHTFSPNLFLKCPQYTPFFRSRRLRLTRMQNNGQNYIFVRPNSSTRIENMLTNLGCLQKP